MTGRTEAASDLARWIESKENNGWVMPSAPAWKRLPIIRHIRALALKWKVESWYAEGPGGMIGLRSGYDDWVLYGVWAGLERER